MCRSAGSKHAPDFPKSLGNIGVGKRDGGINTAERIVCYRQRFRLTADQDGIGDSGTASPEFVKIDIQPNAIQGLESSTPDIKFA
ncbi:MAG TPA: hypothetical protein VK473_05520 [Terriglobales bacterium]|nr:hypothetical protein [Terriglobales bacterium]